MVVNGKHLLSMQPIKNMEESKIVGSVTTYGLGEAGYDIRIKQRIHYKPDSITKVCVHCMVNNTFHPITRFVLASAVEEFQMPENLMGIVHDKSTWARKGLSVFNTVIEPGWCGFLTLELVYHGQEELIIPAGSGIAQVVFHELVEPRAYTGRYQNQEDQPVPAKAATQD